MTLRTEVDVVLDTVLRHRRVAETRRAPDGHACGGRAGRDGVHTEALGYLLAEMQSVARAHPDATW